MNIDGLVYTINQQGIALASYEHRVATLQEENEAIRSALADAHAQLDAENNPHQHHDRHPGAASSAAAQ